MGSVHHHVIKPKDQSFIRQGFGLCRVNGLGRVVPLHSEAFYLLKLAHPALVSEPNAQLTHLMKGEHHPRQQVNRLTDENQIAGEGIPGRIVAFPGAGRFKDEWVRSKRLTSKDGAIVGDWSFKAFGIDAFLWELALFRALLGIADAGAPAKDIAECAAEDVAFVSGHL